MNKIRSYVCLLLTFVIVCSVALPGFGDVFRSAHYMENDETTSGQAADVIPSGYSLSTMADDEGTGAVMVDIKGFSVGLESGATLQDDKYVWTPENSLSGHNFIFDIYYELSGTGDLPVDAVSITIPKHILKNKNGAVADSYIMSMPQKGAVIPPEVDEKTNWVYEETVDTEGNEFIVITNRREISAAQAGYIQVAYTTTQTTFDYEDMAGSNPFNAKIEIKNGEDTVTKTSNDIPVYIDTDVKITSTAKKKPVEVNYKWLSSWGTAPSDAADYYYLVWEIDSIIDSKSTQMYNFKLDDSIIVGTPELEIVGYKMSGKASNYYTSAAEGGNVVENQRATGTRRDYVLTRISKAKYEEKLPTDNDVFSITNQITATVTPADGINAPTTATAQQTYDLKRPVFVAPIGSSSIVKTGGIRNYLLTKFKNNNISRITGLTYNVRAGGYSYAYTLGDGYDENDPEGYGKKDVTFTLVDSNVYLNQEDTPLTFADYEFSSVAITHDVKVAKYNETIKNFDTYTATAANTAGNPVTITYYAKFDGSDDWIEIGSYTIGDTEPVNTNDSYAVLTKSGGSTVTITPVGEHAITGYKAETANKCYSTFFIAKPEVVIKRNDDLITKIGDAEQISVRNLAELTVLDSEGNTVYNNTAQAFDYVNIENKKAEIKKTVSASTNDTINQRYVITWKIAMKEYVLMGSGTTQTPITQQSGIFYDLLPSGSDVDLNSVQVENEQGVLPESAYTVSFTHNYNDSQRTLMQVSISEPGDSYYVYFNTNHTWENISDYGQNVLNPVAYETGNDEIAGGKPDNGEGLSDTNKTYMTDLDSSTNENKFIYYEAPHKISAIISAASGADKKVRSELDSAYSYSAVVTPKKRSYSYRLRYSNNNNSLSADNVIFDFLESYADSGKGIAGSDWKGTLDHIDLSQIISKNIEPKVYYSTVDGIASQTVNEEYIDFATDTNWHLNDNITNGICDFSGITGVTAIAIDMSIAGDNADSEHYKTVTIEGVEINKYLLGEGESVTATVYMKAPETLPDGLSGVSDPAAYNNIYVNTKIFSSQDGESGYESAQYTWIEQNYTTVKYRIMGALNIEKVSADDNTQKVNDVSFRLFGTSDYGTVVDIVHTTDRNGKIKFEDIEKGTYTLVEDGYNPDWLMDYTEHTVLIDDMGDVWVDKVLNNTTYTEEAPYVVENKPRVHADIQFKKQGYYTRNSVKGVKFKLTGTSDYGNDIVKYATSDSIGSVVIEDLEKGTYTMQEVETPQGYGLLNAKFTVVVDENANYKITLNDTVTYNGWLEQQLNGDYIVYNEELTEFAVKKCDSWDNTMLNGATFRLYGVSNNGTLVDITQTTNSNRGAGNAWFSNLESGTYTLQELEAPDGYVRDDKVYIVKIENRTVTIDGLELYDSTDPSVSNIFRFNNAPEQGSLVVKKIWLDNYGDDNTKRLEDSLLIKISTKKPEVKPKTVAYFAKSTQNYGNFMNKSVPEANITAFKRYTGDVTDEFLSSVNAEEIYDKTNPDYPTPIYGWLDTTESTDGTGTYYWYSLADTAKMRSDTMRLFQGMSNIVTIDLTDIDTSEVSNFKSFFNGATNLKSITGTINTDSAQDTGYMFNNCYALTEVDLSGFDASNVTDMSYMFYKCSALTEVDLSGQNASKVTTMQYMFEGCSSLTSVNLKGLDASSVTTFYRMFYNCSNLKTVNMEGFKTSNKLNNMRSMFNGCSALTEVDLSSCDISGVTTMFQMFLNCSSLTSVNMNGLDAGSVETLQELFKGCGKLTTVNMSGFKTSDKLTNMYYIFYGCNALTGVDLSGFNTSNVTTMQALFYKCYALTEVDFSSFDTANVTVMQSMFNECKALKTIYASDKFSTENVTNSSYMFALCNSLEGGAGTTFAGTGKVADKTYARIDLVKNDPDKGGYFTQGPAPSSVSTTGLSASYFAATVETPADIGLISLESAESIVEAAADDTTETTTDSSTVEYDSSGSNGDVTLVKNGNEWTYTFKVNDAEWFAWEDTIPTGYKTDHGEDVPISIVVEDGVVKTVDGVADGVAAITNTKKYVAPGNLTIRKTLFNSNTGSTINNKNASGEYLLDDEYMFTVTLENTEVDFTGTKVYGTTVFTDGVAKVKLKGGDEITFTNIPAGTTYEIVEAFDGTVSNQITVTDSDDAVVSTGTVTDNATATGAITTGNTDTAAYTNTIEADLRDTENFDIVKQVSGSPAEEMEYTINVAFTKLVKNKMYSIVKVTGDGNGGAVETEYKTFTADDTGTADVSVILKDGERVRFKDVPMGAQYRATEEKGAEYKSSYNITNGTVSGAIANAQGANADVNMELATAWETVDADEDITITYTNEIVKTQSLSISKIISGGGGTISTDNTFKFTVKFQNLGGGYAILSTIGKILADAMGSATASFDIKSGETVTFNNIPVGSLFEVIEEDAGKYIPYYETSGADNTNNKTSQSLSTGSEIKTKVDDAQAAVDAATSTLKGKKATLDNAQAAYDADKSAENQAALEAAQSEYDAAKAELERAEAALAVAKALNTASGSVKLNEDAKVSYTNITPYDLVVKKQVGGVFGNKTEEFDFTAYFTYNGLPVEGGCQFKKYSGTEIIEEGALVIADGECSFKLCHNESIRLIGLPYGTVFTVTESGTEDYATVSTIAKDTEGAETEGKTAGGTLDYMDDANSKYETVTFTNTKNGILPTGIHNDLSLPVGVGALALIGIFYLKKRGSIAAED